jgi:hypothetical protein
MRKAVLTFFALLLFAHVVFGGSQTTSSTLASTIIDRVEALFNDTANSFLDATEMLVWVNDGTMDIVSRTHCLEDAESVTLVLGQSNYALSDPFITIKGVIYNSEKALTEGSLSHYGRTISSTDSDGEPEYFFTWENNLFVYPVSSSDTAGNSIDVFVVDRPAPVATGAAVLVPAQYDRALVLYVYAQALYKDRQFAKAGAVMDQYLAELERYRKDFNVQPKRGDVD